MLNARAAVRIVAAGVLIVVSSRQLPAEDTDPKVSYFKAVSAMKGGDCKAAIEIIKETTVSRPFTCLLARALECIAEFRESNRLYRLAGVEAFAIFFEYHSTEPTVSATELINRIKDSYRTDPSAKVAIVGHFDPTTENESIGAQRARSIARSLLSMGVLKSAMDGAPEDIVDDRRIVRGVREPALRYVRVLIGKPC